MKLCYDYSVELIKVSPNKLTNYLLWMFNKYSAFAHFVKLFYKRKN